jgi:hypothetical protein
VLYVNPTEFGETPKKTRDADQLLVVASLATLYKCKFVEDSVTRRGFFLIGRSKNRRIAQFMITTILKAMERSAEKAYVAYFYECRNNGDVTAARGYKAAFKRGFAIAVAANVEAKIKEQRQGPGVGLIRLDQEMAAVKSFMDLLSKSGALQKSAAPAFKDRDHDAGLRHGMAEGRKQNISSNGIESTPSGPVRQIAGPK